MKYTPEVIKEIREGIYIYGEAAEDIVCELLDEIEYLQWLIISRDRYSDKQTEEFARYQAGLRK